MALSRNIDDLVPEARPLARLLLQKAADRGIKLIITSTLRTKDEQAALYAQGRESITTVNTLRAIAKLPPISEKENRPITWTTRSRHLKGTAWDVCIIDALGRPVWDEKAYEPVAQIGRDMGLVVGMDFKKMVDGDLVPNPDPPHFEMRPGYTNVGLRG